MKSLTRSQRKHKSRAKHAERKRGKHSEDALREWGMGTPGVRLRAERLVGRARRKVASGTEEGTVAMVRASKREVLAPSVGEVSYRFEVELEATLPPPVPWRKVPSVPDAAW